MGKRKVKNEVDRDKFKKRKIAAKVKAKRALMNKDRIDKPQFDMQEKKLLRIATKGGMLVSLNFCSTWMWL